jgi:hypothetical protein
MPLKIGRECAGLLVPGLEKMVAHRFGHVEHVRHRPAWRGIRTLKTRVRALSAVLGRAQKQPDGERDADRNHDQA